MADTTRTIIDLREQVARQRKRFGWTFGPSIGISGIVTQDFDVKWVPAAGFSLTWGWRSK